MKDQKNNTPQYFLVAAALVAVTVSYNYFKNVQLEYHSKQRVTKERSEKQEIKKEQTVGRKIASIPTGAAPLLTKYQNRTIVGNFSRHKQLPLSNKINENWMQLALGKLDRYTQQDTKLKIEHVKPAIFVKHNIGRYVEHVKIILKKDNGLVSAYDAYIDSQSGNIIRTWNRTEIEFKPDFKLNAQGKGYIGLPIQKDDPKASL